MKNQELSFEFFPTRTAKGAKTLETVHTELALFEPSFFSVTYGAGGSTQEGTFDAIKRLRTHNLDAAPHLTCVGASRDLIRDTISSYIDIGVTRLVVLRGDLPGGMVDRGRFKYATDLVSFIRSEFNEPLHLEVAAYPDCHPESTSPISELKNFKRKIDAGANSAITQYFYNADSYFAFLDEAARLNINAPIVPGIMPITNYATLIRFSDACGAEIPRWIRSRLHQYRNDDASLKSFGFDVVANLCMDLLENNAPGLHFYTLNKIEPVKQICTAIGYAQNK